LSTQGATQLFERISNDEDFRRRLEGAATPAEKRRIATEAGYEVGREDLVTIRSLAGLDEMSDEDLHQVAAGASISDIAGAHGPGEAWSVGHPLVSAGAPAVLALGAALG
jgi:predicted ribosomally synthesized peptide with nif11-like leader